MVRRHIILAVLHPHFDVAAARFRVLPTHVRLTRLRNVAEAMECAHRRPLRILAKILKNVPPEDYVRVICSYEE